MALLRRVLGETLRGQRLRQRRTLREVSSTARVSLGYLSEIERGQKEASSELLAAICDALGVRLSEVLREVSDTMYRSEAPVRPVPTVPEPKLAGVGAKAAASQVPRLPTLGDQLDDPAAAPAKTLDPLRVDQATDALQPVDDDHPLEPMGSEQALLDHLADSTHMDKRTGTAWPPADGLDSEIRSLTERHAIVAAA